MKRSLLWLSKGLLGLAGAACIVLVAAAVLLATVFPARTGCEECGTHFGLVVLTFLSIAVAMVSVVLAAVVAFITTWL